MTSAGNLFAHAGRRPAIRAVASETRRESADFFASKRRSLMSRRSGAVRSMMLVVAVGASGAGFGGSVQPVLAAPQLPMAALNSTTSLTTATAIAAGAQYSLALKADGTVWAWGRNQDGELGNGTTTDSANPVQASGLSGVIAISAGDTHAMALKSDGTVWAWGANSWGQLGDGTTSSQSTPVIVSGLTGMTAIGAGVITRWR